MTEFTTWRSLVDGELITVIPDSEAEDKLLHRYVLGRDNTFEDSVGSLDADNNGTTESLDDWAGGAARAADGETQSISVVDLDEIISNKLDGDTPFALAWSYRTSDQSGAMFGYQGGERTIIECDADDDGKARFLIRDENSDFATVYGGAGADGQQHRHVLNIDPSNAENIEFWTDKQNETDLDDDDGLSADYGRSDDNAMEFLASNDGGVINHNEGEIDDICIFETTLTEDEINSYENPWE